MISEKITSVINRWTTVMRETGTFPYEDFMNGLAELEDAARMAQRLEAKPLPKRFRDVGSEDATADVVNLRAFARMSERRDPRVGGARP